MGVHELLRVQVEVSYIATNSLKFNKGFVGATQLDAQIHNNKALDHVCQTNFAAKKINKTSFGSFVLVLLRTTAELEIQIWKKMSEMKPSEIKKELDRAAETGKSGILFLFNIMLL